MAAILITLIVLGFFIAIYMIKNLEPVDDCEHKNTFPYVDNVSHTCETTTITCLDCHKRLKTETDCR